MGWHFPLAPAAFLQARLNLRQSMACWITSVDLLTRIMVLASRLLPTAMSHGWYKGLFKWYELTKLRHSCPYVQEYPIDRRIRHVHSIGFFNLHALCTVFAISQNLTQKKRTSKKNASRHLAWKWHTWPSASKKRTTICKFLYWNEGLYFLWKTTEKCIHPGFSSPRHFTAFQAVCLRLAIYCWLVVICPSWSVRLTLW